MTVMTKLPVAGTTDPLEEAGRPAAVTPAVPSGPAFAPREDEGAVVTDRPTVTPQTAQQPLEEAVPDPAAPAVDAGPETEPDEDAAVATMGAGALELGGTTEPLEDAESAVAEAPAVALAGYEDPSDDAGTSD
jgi:hypothetical protein